MAHRNVCTVKETVYAAGRHVRRFERFHAGIESGDENYIAESTGNAEARALRNLIQGPALGVGGRGETRACNVEANFSASQSGDLKVIREWLSRQLTHEEALACAALQCPSVASRRFPFAAAQGAIVALFLKRCAMCHRRVAATQQIKPLRPTRRFFAKQKLSGTP